MSATYTIEDFITESTDEFFGYDIMEDCLSLELETMRFMKESINAAIDDLGSVDMESQMESTSSPLSTKSDSILDRIGKLAAKVFNAIKTFFKNIINVFTNSKDEEIKKLRKIIDEDEKLLEKLKSKDIETVKELKVIESLVTEMEKQVEQNNKNVEKYRGWVKELIHLLRKAKFFGKNALSEITEVYKLLEKSMSGTDEGLYPETVAHFDKFHKTFIGFLQSGKNLPSSSNLSLAIKIKFMNLLHRGGDGAVQKELSEIRKFIGIIADSRKKEVNLKFDMDYFKRISSIIENTDNDITTSAINKQAPDKLEKENQELFNKYVSAVSEMIIEYQKMSAETMEIIKLMISNKEVGADLINKLHVAIGSLKKYAVK